MIKGISAGMLTAYNQFVHGKPKSTKEMFSYFSLTIGGNGQTISKTQLDNYITQIDKGVVSTSKKRETALKNLQKNWNKYYKDQDEISEDDFKNHILDFIAIMTTDTDENDENKNKIKDKIKEQQEKFKKLKEKQEAMKEDLKSATQELLDSIKEKNKSSEEGITKSELKDYLSELLNKNDENNDNSDEIDFVSGLITNFDKLTNSSKYLNTLPKTRILTDETNGTVAIDTNSPIDIKI